MTDGRLSDAEVGPPDGGRARVVPAAASGGPSPNPPVRPQSASESLVRPVSCARPPRPNTARAAAATAATPQTT